MLHHNILNYESIAETTRKIVSIFYKSGLLFQPLLCLHKEFTFLKQKEKLALFLIKTGFNFKMQPPHFNYNAVN